MVLPGSSPVKTPRPARKCPPSDPLQRDFRAAIQRLVGLRRVPPAHREHNRPVRRGEDVARRARRTAGMFGGHFNNCRRRRAYLAVARRRRKVSLTFLLV